VILRQIFCIFILFYAGLALGAASSGELPAEPVGSFIDKGNVTLPIAPEIAKKDSAKIELPVISDVESQKPVEVAPITPPVYPAQLPKVIPENKNFDLSPPPLPPILGEKPGDNVSKPIEPKNTDVKSDIAPLPKAIPDSVTPQAKIVDSPSVEKVPAIIVPVAPVQIAAPPAEPVKDPVVSVKPLAPVQIVPVVPVVATPSQNVPAIIVPVSPVQIAAPPAEPVKAPVVSVKPVVPVQIVPVVSVVAAPSQKVRLNKIIPEPSNHLVKKSKVSSVVSPPILQVADPEIEKFVHNESQMLVVPDDDVLLGSLTDDARWNYMGYSEYLSRYLEYRESMKKLKQRNDALAFIGERSAIDGNDIPLLSDKYLFANAVSHIQNNQLDSLRALADNYNILDLIDNRGNTLLHVAAYKDNMNLTKWLIMRGVNVSSINYDSISPRDIAKYEQYWGVFNLLEAANAQ